MFERYEKPHGTMFVTNTVSIKQTPITYLLKLIQLYMYVCIPLT
jgi:hypothetical protein